MQGKPPRNHDRRAPPGERGSVRWLKGVLGRPVALQSDAGWGVVLVERRSASHDGMVPLAELQDELRERLNALNGDAAAKVMRHLVIAHDTLARRGWNGLALWPSRSLTRTLMQAEMLGGLEPSPAMRQLAERLRLLRAEAELREERAQRAQQAEFGRQVDVSEASHEEFEAMERSWAGVVPPDEPPAAR